MRLCIATPLYPPESGGPATYAKTLEEHLPGLGWEVTLVKFGTVKHLPKGVRHFAYLLKMLKAGRQADVILALDPASVGFPAALAAGLLSIPFVVKIVGDFAWEQGTQRAGISALLDEFVHMRRVPLLVSILRGIQRFVAKRARIIIVPSEYLKGIVTTWGIDSQKIEVIYNALSLAEPLPVRTLPQHAIVSVARLVPWKGMRGLMDALDLVRAAVPDATLCIIGDGPERNALEAYASDAVTFLGALPPAETLAHMKAASVLVLNSTYEGLSHVLIEGLLLERPVVATRAGGNPELITDGKNGLLVPVGDTPALAQAIIRVLTKSFVPAPSSLIERFALPTMLARTSDVLSSV